MTTLRTRILKRGEKAAKTREENRRKAREEQRTQYWDLKTNDPDDLGFRRPISIPLEEVVEEFVSGFDDHGGNDLAIWHQDRFVGFVRARSAGRVEFAFFEPDGSTGPTTRDRRAPARNRLEASASA